MEEKIKAKLEELRTGLQADGGDLELVKIEAYLEALSRNSVRLKRLTEDLVEASKASTGNITVNFD